MKNSYDTICAIKNTYIRATMHVFQQNITVSDREIMRVKGGKQADKREIFLEPPMIMFMCLEIVVVSVCKRNRFNAEHRHLHDSLPISTHTVRCRRMREICPHARYLKNPVESLESTVMSDGNPHQEAKDSVMED